MKQRGQGADIAVVGLGAIFPGAKNTWEYWSDIRTGANRLSAVPASHWSLADHFSSDPKAADKSYGRTGGFIPDIAFDPLAFGIPPTALTATDTGQLLALVVAKQVIDDYLQGRSFPLDRSRVAVILGTTGATELIMDLASRLEGTRLAKILAQEELAPESIERVIVKFKANYPEWQESSFPGLLNNVVSGRIAHRLNLKGSNFVTDAACASSLAAVKIAIDELILGRADMVLTGGVDTLNTILMYLCFSKTTALSPSQQCRPFDANCDGTAIGEGLGMLALRRLADAQSSGDRIYAVIKGIGSSSDGLGKSIYAPSAEGQIRAIKDCWHQAGFSSDSVGLIEAHGTGTRAGDETEIESLSHIFANAAPMSVALASVKAQIGHTKAAAGAAGLIKACLALHHRVLPPQSNVSLPNPKIHNPRSPFFINQHARPWIQGLGKPRRAGVSSFGFGGTNFHVALQEASEGARYRILSHELLVVGAKSVAELHNELRQLHSKLQGESLAACAEYSQRNYSSGAPLRMALVVNPQNSSDKVAQAIHSLDTSAAHSPATGRYFGSGYPTSKLALLFPGQGSQYLGMGSELAINFASTRRLWDQAADLEFSGAPANLHNLVFPPKPFTEQEQSAQEGKLQATQWAQPSIVLSSASFYSWLAAFGVRAHYHIGHSLGELSALWASKAVSLDAVLGLAAERGRLMGSKDIEASAMIAVQADHRLAAKVCKAISSPWVLANLNTSQQTVLSGPLQALPPLEAELRRHRLHYKRLPVSAGCHSPGMRVIARDFSRYLEHVAFAPPTTPIIAGIDARPFASEAAKIRETLVASTSAPVRFVDQIQTLYKHGVRHFIEVGPQSVLANLTRNILKDRPVHITALDERSPDKLYSLWSVVAHLAAAGFALEFTNICDEFICEQAGIAPKHSVKIGGANIKRSVVKPPNSPPKLERQLPVGTIAKKNAHRKAERKETQSMGKAFDEEAHIAWMNTVKEAHLSILKLHEGFQKQVTDAHLAYLESKAVVGPSPREEIASTVTEQFDQAALTQARSIASLTARSELEAAPLEAKKAATFQGQDERVSPPSLASETSKEAGLSIPQDLETQALGSEPSQGESLDPKILEDVMACIADKTGYPRDMLQSEQLLDQDLGIDSIKRVEVLSTLSESYEALANADASDLNAVVSIGDIVEFIASHPAVQKDEVGQLKKKLQPSAPLPADSSLN